MTKHALLQTLRVFRLIAAQPFPPLLMTTHFLTVDCLRDLCHKPAKSMRSDQRVVRLPYITKYTRSNVFVGFFSAQIINSRSFREELCTVSWMTNSPSNVALTQILMRSSLLNEQFYLCGYVKSFVMREVSTFEIKGWRNTNEVTCHKHNF